MRVDEVRWGTSMVLAVEGVMVSLLLLLLLLCSREEELWNLDDFLMGTRDDDGVKASAAPIGSE